MDDSFPWEDLLDYIQDGKVVPILGHELLQAEYQGRHVTLQRLLAERLAEREKLEVQWKPHFELNDAVCAYLANPRAKLVGLYDRIAGFLRSLNPPFPVPDALLRLAEIRPFDLFMSVTFDSLMARALDQVRFGGNAVTREIEFSINLSTAAQSEALKVRPGETPIVFNLFGRAVSKSDFALHDEDALEFIHRLVIYSLADHKPLLSRFDEGPVAVAPDGSWIAVARRLVSDEQTWAVDVIPIDLAFNSDFPSRTRIPMEEPSTQITEIYAAQSSVVAVLQAERATTTVVFDATTGKRRFDPLEGQVEELGTARELLLIRDTKPPWGRVLTKDGSPLAPWGELSAADGPPVFLVSPGKEALAVLRGQAGNAKEANAIVYSVRGDGLVLAGQVVGLPAELLSDPDRLQLADDARSITETRWEDNVPEKFVWPVTSGREAASARPAPAVETPVVSANPSGRFEMREESEADTDVRTFTVVRRAFGNVEEHPLKSFRDPTYRFGHRFSSDDRWLATWNEKGIQILDLGRGENAWDLDPGGVKNVDFEAGNAILNVQLSGDATTLIPLDGALMERFAKWLVPGALTPEERCQYGLESEEKCR